MVHREGDRELVEEFGPTHVAHEQQRDQHRDQEMVRETMVKPIWGRAPEARRRGGRSPLLDVAGDVSRSSTMASFDHESRSRW